MKKQEKELMLKQIIEFERQTMFKLDVKNDKPYYQGFLMSTSDYLPDNLVIDGELRCFKESKKLPKGLKVKKKLDISETNITEIPDDCEFGSLDMSETKITKLRDNLELDELLTYNSSLQQFPKGLKVNGDLDISYTDIMEIPDDCEFGSLYMCNTRITKLRDNLILSDLWIDNTFLKELPKNLVVFNMLKMSNKSITTLPIDCLVNRIYSKFDINDKRYKKNVYGEYYLKNEIIHISHPSGREFLHVDGILSKVIEKKGNVYCVHNDINGPITYIVTDGNNYWTRGNTLEEAKQALAFKLNKRDKSEYEKLTLESELTFDEAVACYCVITGACKFGVYDYFEHSLPKLHKAKYSIKEMIELTNGEYGSDTFREFFEK